MINDNDKIIYVAPFPGAQWHFTIYCGYVSLKVKYILKICYYIFENAFLVMTV